jgi:hypothetical protein
MASVKDGLNELDQTHAVFSALTSFWWRLLVFFVCFWIGHYVALNAATGGQFLRAVWQDGPSHAFAESHLNPILAVISWFGVLILGCENPAGALYLFVVGTAFLIVRLSEDYYFHGFAVGLLIQPIHTLLVLGFAGGAPFDLAVTMIVLVTWEVGIGALYWWWWRQMR